MSYAKHCRTIPSGSNCGHGPRCPEDPTADCRAWARPGRRSATGCRRCAATASCRQFGSQFLVEMLDRCRSHTLAEQIDHDRPEARTILHRGRDPFGKSRTGFNSALATAAAMRPMLGDDQRLRLGQIENLASVIRGGHRRCQQRATVPTALGIVVDGRVQSGELGARSRLCGPFAHPKACPRARANSGSGAPSWVSSARRWTAACHYSHCSAQAGAPIPQPAPSMPHSRPAAPQWFPSARRSRPAQARNHRLRRFRGIGSLKVSVSGRRVHGAPRCDSWVRAARLG